MTDEIETGYRIRLIKDFLEAGASYSTPLAPLPRVLYCNAGSFAPIVAGAPGDTVAADQAWFGVDPVAIRAGGEGCEVWRWELAGEDDEPELTLGEGGRSTLMMTEPVDTLDPGADWLMRCDSVMFPPGGTALLHTHQGPGIRCLRDGTLRIESGGKSHDYAPGEAWFENGPEPVFAAAAEEGCSRFIRVMILPRELKGKSSIRYVNEEDLDKPKSQRYKGYVDECIEH